MRRHAIQATERESSREVTVAPSQRAGFNDAAPKRPKICRFAIARRTTIAAVRRARPARRSAPASRTSTGRVARAAEGALRGGFAATSPFQTRKLMITRIVLRLAPAEREATGALRPDAGTRRYSRAREMGGISNR